MPCEWDGEKAARGEEGVSGREGWGWGALVEGKVVSGRDPREVRSVGTGLQAKGTASTKAMRWARDCRKSCVPDPE